MTMIGYDMKINERDSYRDDNNADVRLQIGYMASFFGVDGHAVWALVLPLASTPLTPLLTVSIEKYH